MKTTATRINGITNKKYLSTDRYFLCSYVQQHEGHKYDGHGKLLEPSEFFMEEEHARNSDHQQSAHGKAGVDDDRGQTFKGAEDELGGIEIWYTHKAAVDDLIFADALVLEKNQILAYQSGK